MARSRLKKKNRQIPYEAKVIDKNILSATYFGFNPIKTPQIIKNDQTLFKIINDPYSELPRAKSDFPLGPEALEKISLLRTFNEWSLSALWHPVFVSFYKPLSGSDHRRRENSVIYGLEIFGLQSSSAEGILLRTLISILEDEGYTNLNIRINSLGDKESINEFERAVGGFIRKNISEFPAELRKLVKEDFFEICRKGAPEKFLESVPKSINFLSEIPRNHLKETLEFIESFGIPYTIDHTLVASPYFCSETIFEIETLKGLVPEVLASGYRYSRLSRKLGIFKKEVTKL